MTITDEMVGEHLCRLDYRTNCNTMEYLGAETRDEEWELGRDHLRMELEQEHAAIAAMREHSRTMASEPPF